MIDQLFSLNFGASYCMETLSLKFVLQFVLSVKETKNKSKTQYSGLQIAELWQRILNAYTNCTT